MGSNLGCQNKSALRAYFRVERLEFRLGPGPVADLRSLRLFQCRHQRIGRHAHQLPPIGSNFGALHHIDEENKVQGPWLTA